MSDQINTSSSFKKGKDDPGKVDPSKADPSKADRSNSDQSSPERSQADFNRGGMIAFLFSMAVTLLYFVYVCFLSGGVDLKEINATQTATGAVAGTGAASANPGDNSAGNAADKPVDISGIKEPWLENSAMVAHGAQLFKTNCALCHGQEGKGDGPAGAGLSPRPRNMVEGKWKKGGTSLGLFGVLTNGLPPSAMASYAHLPAADRWALVQFVRSITKNKVADKMDELKQKAPTLK